MKRQTWKDRNCHCGKRVETRVQTDAVYCGSSECWDKIMADFGYIPSPETLKTRAEKASKRATR